MLVYVGLSSRYWDLEIVEINKIKCQARLLGGQAIEIAVSRVSMIGVIGFQHKL